MSRGSLQRALSESDVLSCLVRYDPHSGHHWGKLLPTLIMSAIGGLAEYQAGREWSPYCFVSNRESAACRAWFCAIFVQFNLSESAQISFIMTNRFFLPKLNPWGTSNI